MDSPLFSQYKKRPLGLIALFILLVLVLVAIYAPCFASSKPFFLRYHGKAYFPLWRYLFFRGFYTKAIDLFFNLMILTLPLALLVSLFRWRKIGLFGVFFLQVGAFTFLLLHPLIDPAHTDKLAQGGSFSKELASLNAYGRLNLIFHAPKEKMRLEIKQAKLQKGAEEGSVKAAWQLHYLKERGEWLTSEQGAVTDVVMPFFRPYHWEERAVLSHTAPWYLRSRVNGKDLVAALIFGIRVSIVVGVLATTLSLFLGVPLGAVAGYFGGKLDILLCRLIEAWEAMPSFLMLLLIVALLQSKSIFLVIGALAAFSWPPICRMVRAEVLRQKALPYVQAARSQGFPERVILFSEILPNAIVPILSLLPFCLMVAITSEAGLSFLGLGEEGGCSLGVLMDEGRAAFPANSDLLWPPAILLSCLLVAIALVGDTLRDALDPKLRLD